MLLVMGYHAGLPLGHGFLGVDVFFVISGFLITGILARELLSTGTVSWPRFLARRVRRLLPAAAVVLVVTALVALVVVPGLRRREIGSDVVGAAFYVVNWVLADRAVDYLAADAFPSPVQHFWSLAVEEQFYVVWPLALLVLAALLRRVGRRPTVGTVGLLLAGLCLPSFGYAVWLGHVDPDRAYFVTTTRAWELGVGAALALWCLRSEAGSPGPRAVGAGLLGWLGLVAVLGSAVWLPAAAVTPGPWTLVPTLGAAAVLWSGWAAPGGGPSRLLGAAPLVWVGGLSYSLYLWHWPAVVLTQWAADGLTPTQRVLAVALSVVPAWACHRFLEAPVHHSRVLARRARPALALGVALSTTAALAAAPLLSATSPFRTQPVAGAVTGPLGADALASAPGGDPVAEPVDDWGWLTPDPQLAGEDRPAADVDHCQVDRLAVEPVRCTFGVDGPVTVALVGDSKAMQWLPALERMAPGRGWRVVTYGKSACAFADGHAQEAGRAYPQCDRWNAAVVDRLRADPPDLLVTSGYATTAWDRGRTSREALVGGLASRWSAVSALGVPVVVVGDSPVSPDDLDVCAARHPTRLTRCAFDRRTAVARSGLPAQRSAAAASGAQLVDLTPWICPAPRCPVAVGHVTIHRAGDHVTATYARSLAPVLAPRLDAVLRLHLGEDRPLR